MKNETHQRAPRGAQPMSSRPTAGLQRKALAVLLAACFGSAQGNPLTPQVAAGQATFNQQGKLYSITNTPNTIINWQSFSINADEITRFIQQNGDSKVLNRITGQDPSQILGALQSNGKVFLINPNGVLFGQGARVDVNGLVASSLAISDADFLAGKHSFAAGPGAGKVANQGVISTPAGGQVFLIAPSVENNGLITSPQGQVVLAAGHSVQLVDSGDPDIHVVVSAPADQTLNLGRVVARGGRIGIYGALVNQRGAVNADSAVLGEHGQVVLKSSATTLLEAGSVTSATGAGTGGTVKLLGKQVGLTGDARVDASGQGGGGTVLVGGDYHGGNAAVPNAQASYVGADAVIAADAGAQGQGGKLIVWGDDATRVHGTLSARGGALGGDGGFIETSGHYLNVDGVRASAAAPRGRGGQWLLDPFDINVATGGSATLGDVLSFGTDVSGTSTIAPSVISSASSQVILRARHNLTFSGAVDIAASEVGLRGEAGNNIVVNAPIKTNGGNVALFANDNSAETASGSGSVTQGSSGNITTAFLAASGAAVTLNNPGNHVDVVAGATTAGDFKLTTNGSLVIDGVEGLFGIIASQSGSAIRLTSGAGGTGGILQHAPGPLSASKLFLAAPGTGSVDISAAGTNQIGALQAENVGSLTFVQPGALTLGIDSGKGVSITSGSDKTLSITTGGALTAAGPVTSNGSSLNLTGSSVNVGAAITGGAGTVMLTGTDSETGHVNIDLNKTVSGGEIFLSGASIGVTGSIIGTSLVALDATRGSTGQITTAGTTVIQGSNVALSADQMVFNSTSQIKAVSNSSPTVSIKPASGTASISLGAGVVDGEGGLALTDAEIKTIKTGTLVIGTDSGYTGGISVLGTLDLSTSGTVGTDMHMVTGGSVLFSQPMTLVKPLTVVAGGHIANNTLLKAKDITLIADDIRLAGGAGQGLTANNGSGNVLLAAFDEGKAVELGTDALSTDNPAKLRITAAGMAAISAGELTVAGNGVDVLSALSLPTTNLNLISTDALNVQAAVTGKGVILTSGSDAAMTITAPVSGGTVALSSGGPLTVESAITATTIAELISTGTMAITSTGSVTGTQVGLVGTGAVNVAGPVTGTIVGIDGTDVNLSAVVTATEAMLLAADTLAISVDVTAPLASIRPKSVGRPITLGDDTCVAGPACLAIADLVHVHAPTIGIGSDSVSNDVGVVTVVGITDGADEFTDRWTNTTRIGLLSGAGVTQTGPIDVHDLGVVAGIGNLGGSVLLTDAGNSVVNLASRQGVSGNFSFTNSTDLAVARLQGGTITNDLLYDVSGISSPGDVTLTVAGALTRSGSAAKVTGNNLVLTTTGGVGTTSTPLLTSVTGLDVVNTSVGSAPINIQNVDHVGEGGAYITLEVNRAWQSLAVSNSGAISIDNTGGMDIPAGSGVVTGSGAIALKTHSPLTINGPIGTDSGPIILAAGGGADAILTIGAGGAISSVSGPVQLTAGAAIVGVNSGNVMSPQVSVVANTNSGNSLPTLEACLITPTLSGCSTVLPTLNSCLTTPTAQGCAVVLPTLSACIASPSTSGCAAVLPTLAACTTNPGAPGCSAVLPTVETCVANPSAPGCTATLPTQAACVANPALPGCSAVLPSLAACVLNPTVPGCSAVLPTLSSCLITPSAAGCSAVLPTLAACVAQPSTSGCAAVLPSVSACVNNPSAEGCSFVLPTLASCVANPTVPGCAAILPTLASCLAHPAAQGCSVVLPSLSACVANPAASGCEAVLPSLAACVAAPTSAGCASVLPGLAQCLAAPTEAGCAAVLPTLSECAATPTAPGCAAVLPQVDLCVSNPSLPTCVVVTPHQDSPVQQANNTLIQVVNLSTVSYTLPATAKVAELTGTASGGTGGNSGLASTPDSKRDKVDDKSNKVDDKTASNDKSGVKDAPSKKMYCN